MIIFASAEAKYNSFWVKIRDVLKEAVVRRPFRQTERIARALVATISILLSPPGSSSRVKGGREW